MPNTNGVFTARLPRGNHKSNTITLKKKKKASHETFLAMTLQMVWKGEKFVLCHLPKAHSHLPAYDFAFQYASYNILQLLKEKFPSPNSAQQE